MTTIMPRLFFFLALFLIWSIFRSLEKLPPKANLSIKEVADYLGISPQKVYQMVACGSLPSKRIDRTIRIPRETFQTWWQSLPSACEL